MRIIKSIPNNHLECRYIPKDTHLGQIISMISEKINHEEEFLTMISGITFLDFSQVSLWSFVDILNYLDDLLAKYKKDITKNEKAIEIILDFYLLIFKDNLNKEIFCSFDHLIEIYYNSFSSTLKGKILQVYDFFFKLNKSLCSFFNKFEEFENTLDSFREILVEIILNKQFSNLNSNEKIKKNLETILQDIEKLWHKFLTKNSYKIKGNLSYKELTYSPKQLFNLIVRNNQNFKIKENFKDCIKEYDYFNTEYKAYEEDIGEEIDNITNNSAKKEILNEEKNYIFRVKNFLVMINDLYNGNNDTSLSSFKSVLSYVLIMLNFQISPQKSPKYCISITEYNIERYLKDVLSILISPTNLEIKNIFLAACIDFIKSLDGYESILFQNGLFHSLLSDLTHQNGENLEVLTQEESINEDFFNSVLLFLFKSHSFKEIPVHFLNKIIQPPESSNIYPHRLDNVILSLKKKRGLNESSLSEVLLPRLIFEIKNLFNDQVIYSNFICDPKKKHSPTIYERTDLINKILKIFYKFFEMNLNLNTIKPLEEQIFESIINFFKDERTIASYEYDFAIVVFFIFFIKIFYYYSFKVSKFVEDGYLEVIFHFLEKKIPRKSGFIWLLISFILLIAQNEQGKKFINQENCVKNVVLKVFEEIGKEENYFIDYFKPQFLEDEDLNFPFNSLLKVEGISEFLTFLFESIEKYTKNFQEKYLNCCKLTEINSELEYNTFCFKLSKSIKILSQFYISIFEEEKFFLSDNVKTDFKALFQNYYKIFFNPTILYLVANETYLNDTIIETISENNNISFVEQLNVSLLQIVNEMKDSSLTKHLSKLQKEKIYYSLIKLVEISIRKSYKNLEKKECLNPLIINILTLIRKLSQDQLTARMYLAPINDYILAIDDKYFKFLSSKLNPNLLRLLKSNTLSNLHSSVPTVYNPKLTFFDETNYQILLDVDFSKPLKINVLSKKDLNSFFLDNETKTMLGNLATLDIFYSLGKTLKAKCLRELKETDVNVIQHYITTAYLLYDFTKTMRINGQNIIKKFIVKNSSSVINEIEGLEDIVQYDEVLKSLFLYITSLNNIINALQKKNFSYFIIYYFIIYGGINEVFQICKNVLLLSEKIQQMKKAPLIILLMLSNFWDICGTLVTNLLKVEFENQTGYFLILLKENISKFNLNGELTFSVKYFILKSFVDIIFENDIQKGIENLQNIQTNAYPFYIMCLNIINDFINSYKTLIDKNLSLKTEDFRIEDLEAMGFTKEDILVCMSDGIKKKNDIINMILSKDEDKEKDADEEKKSPEKNEANNNNENPVNIPQEGNNLQQENNPANNSEQNLVNNSAQNLEPKKPEEKENTSSKKEESNKGFPYLKKVINLDIIPSKELVSLLEKSHNDEYVQTNEDDSKMIIDEEIFKESPEDTMIKREKYSKANYLDLLSFLYQLLGKEALNFSRATQLRKMNLQYRIKDLKNETELIEYIKQISNLEKELLNLSSEMKNNNINLDTLKNILSCKMMLNYIIIKDRTKFDNVYEKLDLDKFNEFLIESKLIDMNLQYLSIFTSIPTKQPQEIEIIQKIIYEILFTIYTIFSFKDYFYIKKNIVIINDSEEKKKFLEIFDATLESHPEKFNEEILILFLNTLNQNYHSMESKKIIYEYINKNILSKLLSLKISNGRSYCNFYEKEFKSSVTLDETLRNFIFEIFIDDKNYEKLLIGIFKYVLANINEKENKVELDCFLKIVKDLIYINKEVFDSSIQKIFDIIHLEEKVGEHDNNDDNDDNEEEDNSDKDNQDRNNSNKDKAKKTKMKTITYLKLKSSFVNDINQINSELRQNNKDKNKDLKDNAPKTPKEELSTLNKVQQNKHNNTEKKNEDNQKTTKKFSDDQISLISTSLSPINLTIIDTLIKHIWKTTLDLEKEIEKTYSANSLNNLVNNPTLNTNQFRKYYFDLDSTLISFGSLINAFPEIISIILKYHKQKPKISFISFLVNKVFFVLFYYRNSIVVPEDYQENSQLMESLTKERDKTIKKLGNEFNCYQSVLEAYRNVNIISFVMQSLCYKRRNMNENEVNLISKVRKKILNEINIQINEISTKKIVDYSNQNVNSINNNLNNPSNTNTQIYLSTNPNVNLPKNIVKYKCCVFLLFSITEFHESSHLYSQYNPFEISKLLFSKEYSIIKNICNFMKSMPLSSKLTSPFHKMATIFLSEVFKYIRINSKMKKPQIINPQNSFDDDEDLSNNPMDNDEINFELRFNNNDEMDIPMEENENLDDENEEMEDEEDEMIYTNSSDSDNEDENMENSSSFEENVEDSSNGSNDHDQSMNDEASNSNDINNAGLFGDRNINDPRDMFIDVPRFDGEAEFYEEDEDDEEEEEEEEEINEVNFNMNNSNVGINNNDGSNDNSLNSSINGSEEDIPFNNRLNISFNANVNPIQRFASIFYGRNSFFNQNGNRTQYYLNGIPLNNLNNNNLNLNNNNNLESDDKILFLDPNYDKINEDDSIGTVEKCHYLEEIISFPFTIITKKTEILDFYKPDSFISAIIKLNKVYLEKSNVNFLNRFINPFDNKFKRNISFIMSGFKGKIYSAYVKEISMIADGSEMFRNEYAIYDDSTKYAKDIKDKLMKKYPIQTHEDQNLDNYTNKPLKLKPFKDDDKSNSKNKDESKQQPQSASSKLNENLISLIPEELRSDVRTNLAEIMDTGNNQSENHQENQNIEQNNPEQSQNNHQQQMEIDDIQQNNNQNNQNSEQNNQNPVQNQDQISNQNIQENSGNQPDVIDNQFITSLPQDLREEILLTLEPTMIRHLSAELREEYDRLHNNIIQNEDILARIDDPFQQLFNYLPIRHVRNKKRKSIKLEKIKYNIEDIINEQKHSKENSSFILSLFDDEFLENLLIFNLKLSCEEQQKNNILNNNYYWILTNHLIQNVHLRHKIFDLFFIFWVCDSTLMNHVLSEKICKKSDFFKNSLLKNLYELFIEEKVDEDFYYEDYEQFITIFSTNFQKEMTKLFLKTSYNEKGEYVSNENHKIYSLTKNCGHIKELFNLKFDNQSNVLSNLLSLMLINSKSDIKKIFALKIFTIVIQNCFKNQTDKSKDNAKNNANENKADDENKKDDEIKADNENKEEGNNANKNKSDKNKADGNNSKNPQNTNQTNLQKTNNNVDILKVSSKTIQKIIDLFYNFEIVLRLNKGVRNNNPTLLLCEMIFDHKFYLLLLAELLRNIENLDKKVSMEMDNFFVFKKLDIQSFKEPLPGNVLFKIVKLVNQLNDVISKKFTEKNTSIPNIKQTKKEMKAELKCFIKKINKTLTKCWEKLDFLLYEINTQLKDDQKNLNPKLNRLIPYLDAFITLSHLQFLSDTNEIEKTQNRFIIEQTYRKTPHSTPRKRLIMSPNSPYVGTFTEFFNKFCEKNKKAINLIIRRYPKMFPQDLTIKISNILDLENKKKYFKSELKKLPTGLHSRIDITVRRNELFQDSFSQLNFKSAEQLRNKLVIKFENEEAVDAGGVKREWFTLLVKEMFNPNYMLFSLTKNGTTYAINPDSGKYNNEHLRQFEFVGKMIAKAINDGVMLDCYFTRSFYKIISNTPLTYHDIEDNDPEFYNSLKWLLENDITGTDVYLNYSYIHENLGQIEVIDLVENGRNIDVNEQNKFDYVQKLCYAKLFDKIKPQIEAFLKGFYEIIPLKLISIFDYRELELVISGLPTIDINDLKANTVYENYSEDSEVIKNFWEILESFDNDERAEFLMFVTGSSKVPLEGFAYLQGIGGVNKFKIAKVFEKNFDRLPTAHTCTNQLDLPEYPSKEILHERLTLAIKEGKYGFGFV